MIAFVIFSNNILTFPDTFDTDKTNHRIQHLILNRMNYNWNHVSEIFKEYFKTIQLEKFNFNLIVIGNASNCLFSKFSSIESLLQSNKRNRLT